MTLDDAIRHAEAMAEGYEEDISKWVYTLSEYRKRECVEQTTIPRCEKALNRCKQCASEHRQLAEWLRDYKRLKEQEPKTGHWKRISMDKYTTHAHYWYKCDKCGEHNLGNTDWCPNCGARMIEPQETKQPEISSFYGLRSYIRQESEEE